MFKIKIFNTIIFVSLVFFIFGKQKPVQANEKYVTLVNPVRSRILWRDKSLQPLTNQYQPIVTHQLKSTWLIQSDVFQDVELVNQIKKFNQDQELGIFLEVSPNLATQSRVYYPTETPWYSPKAVFLSSYQPLDRKKIIDQIIINFKNTFGYFPKSAGAWWIDSWSQQYLENKYQINNLMIVADQKTTDNYGIWGQWWGYPYIPSADNILVPGNSKTVVIQWAQRDLEKAYYGSGPLVSNYSLQANDYISQKLDLKYFQNLANLYLSIKPLGQITVGLETGIESVGHEHEYERQLSWISQNKITSLTMSEFGDKYRAIYNHKNPPKIVLADWVLTPEYRENLTLDEKTLYQPDISFADKFTADKSEFLNRILPQTPDKQIQSYWPYFLLLIPVLFWFNKNLSPILFILILYLPIFRSYYSSSWKIFFGPQIDNLILGQILILVLGVFLVTKISYRFKINWSSWLSVWIINFLIFISRFSVIDGKYYLGFLLDNFRFIGVSLGNGLKFINQDLVGYVAATMLKFDLIWIWGNWWVWLIVYPATQIGLIILINKFISNRIRWFMAVLSIFFIIFLFNLSPSLVK